MKKHITYECEICGKTSTDKSAIQRCEARGNKANYHKEQTVIICFPDYSRRSDIRGLEPNKDYEAIIIDSSVDKRNHKVTYTVIVPKEDDLQIWHVPQYAIKALE